MPRPERRGSPLASITSEQTHVPTHEAIAARAYELYLQRGAEDGQDLRDWLQAEQELSDDRALAV